jgi:DNA modification methylase
MTTDVQPYITDDATGEGWRLMLGDSCERLTELADESVDLSIYSPPFDSMYTYSPHERDIGNCMTREEFLAHYAFVIDQMYRLTKPGRISAVHCMQIPILKAREGYTGLTDFRGQIIAAHQAAGWIYYGEVVIDKNPQIQAVRTKAQGLMFVQLRRDSIKSRPALPDYVLLFHKPGENQVPVKPEISNETWIEWARPVWFGIREMDTLNPAPGTEESDERHICPLQLDLIERAVRLWSNPGELVLSPFAGIGSEGYIAVKNGRRSIGCELKPSYWQVAVDNMRRAENEARQESLFGGAA